MMIDLQQVQNGISRINDVDVRLISRPACLLYSTVAPTILLSKTNARVDLFSRVLFSPVGVDRDPNKPADETGRHPGSGGHSAQTSRYAGVCGQYILIPIFPGKNTANI